MSWSSQLSSIKQISGTKSTLFTFAVHSTIAILLFSSIVCDFCTNRSHIRSFIFIYIKNIKHLNTQCSMKNKNTYNLSIMMIANFFDDASKNLHNLSKKDKKRFCKDFKNL